MSFVEATSTEVCAPAVLHASGASGPARIDDVALFERLVRWLNGNEASIAG